MVEGDFQLFEGKWSVEQVEIFSHSFFYLLSVDLDHIPSTSFLLVLIV